MKTISLTTIISLLCFAGQAQAQTDITNTYLTNAGFDNSSSWVTTNVSQPAAETVTGWVSPTSASWCASGSANFGSTYTINGNTVPATNSNGSTSGGCLYMRLGWGANYAYTQNITLPAGFYRLSYKVYNNGGAENVAANNTGFTTSNGIKFIDTNLLFTQNTWTEHSIYIYTENATSGTISIGYQAFGDAGSGGNASLAYDYIKLEKLDTEPSTTETVDLSANITNVWTNGGNTYTKDGVVMREHYNASLFTGEVMNQSYTLVNGLYEAEVYCQANVANWDGWATVVSDGDETVSLKANNITQLIPVYNYKGLDQGLKLYTLTGIEVTNGTLTFDINNDAQGANWHTALVKSIKQIGVYRDLSTLQAQRDANVAAAQAIDQTHLTPNQVSALNSAIAAGNNATTEAALIAANSALSEAIAAANTQIYNFKNAYGLLETALTRFEIDYNQIVADGTNYGRRNMSQKAWTDLLEKVNDVTAAMDESYDYSSFATTAQALNEQLDATDVSIRLFKSYLSMVQGCKSLELPTSTYETDYNTETDATVAEAISALNTLFTEYAATQDADFSTAGFLGDNLDFSAALGDLAISGAFPELHKIDGWRIKTDGLSDGSGTIYMSNKSDESNHSTNLYIRKNWYASPVTLQALKEVMLPVGSYTLTYWINSNSDNIAINLCFYDINGTPTSLGSSNGSWTQVTKNIEITDAPQPFDLSFGFVTSGSGNAPAQILIDDITLTYNAMSQFQLALNAARNANANDASGATTSAIAQWEEYEGNEGDFTSPEERQRAINILNNAVTIAQNNGSATSLIANVDFTGGTTNLGVQGSGGQTIVPAEWTFYRDFEGWNDTKVENGYFNAWAGVIKLAELYQTLSDMPNGQYRLTANVMTDVNDGSSALAIYGNPQGGNVGRSPEVTGEKDIFSNYSVDFQVAENQFSIGIRSDKAYYKVKDFTLTFVETNNATAQAAMIQQDYFWNRGDTDVDLTDSKYAEAVGAVLYPQYVNQVIRVSNAQAIASPTKNIVANGTCENFEIIDGQPLAIKGDSFIATTATYTRNMGNTYGTLILPYEANANSDVQFFHLSNVLGDTSQEEGVLQFSAASHIDANTPILVKKVNSEATGISIIESNVTVENTTAEQNDETTTSGWSAEGYYSEQQFTDYSGLFYIASNQFWAATGTLTVKPFRAIYIYAGDTPANVLKISIDDTPNAIMDIETEGATPNGIYTIGGQLVRQNSDIRDLAPGLYIINGKKTLIK